MNVSLPQDNSSAIVDHLDRLLREAEVVEGRASVLQAGAVLPPGTDTLVRDAYLRWFNEAFALLPQHHQERFWAPYDGITKQGITNRTYVVSIKQFISDPLAQKPEVDPADWAAAMVGSKRRSDRDRSPKMTWAYSYHHYFLPQFKMQKIALAEAREWYRAQQVAQQYAVPPVPALEGYALHPRIMEVAGERFRSGHFDDAVEKAITAVNEAARQKSGSAAKDGVALMTTVFSAKKPLLRFSQFEAEQQGYMNLFSGAWSALRNPRAHTTSATTNHHLEALELLAFASALMRLVDRAEKVAWGADGVGIASARD